MGKAYVQQWWTVVAIDDDKDDDDHDFFVISSCAWGVYLFGIVIVVTTHYEVNNKEFEKNTYFNPLFLQA